MNGLLYMYILWRSYNTECELQMFKVTFRCYKKSYETIDIIYYVLHLYRHQQTANKMLLSYVFSMHRIAFMKTYTYKFVET